MQIDVSKISSAEIVAMAKQADTDKNNVIEGKELKVFDSLLEKAAKTNPLIADYRESLGLYKSEVQPAQMDTAQAAAAPKPQENTIDEIMAKPVDQISDSDIEKIMAEINKTRGELTKFNKKYDKITNNTVAVCTGGVSLSGAVLGGCIGGPGGIMIGAFCGAWVGYPCGILTALVVGEKKCGNVMRNLRNKLEQLENKMEVITEYKK